MRNLRYFHFRTVIDGEVRTNKVLGWSVRDAVATLRGMLYDGETIVGWDRFTPTTRQDIPCSHVGH